MSKNTAGIIILSIISLTGLGLGGYTFIMTLSPPPVVENQGLILVGIWDALEDNLDFAPHNLQNDWLLEFGDNKLSNPDYISVSNNNTRITLLTSGWYRIHLSVLLGGINLSSIYMITIFKDGAIEKHLDLYATSANSSVWNHHIDSSAFVYSNGTNYIEITGISTKDFHVAVNNIFNQLTIEYVL